MFDTAGEDRAEQREWRVHRGSTRGSRVASRLQELRVAAVVLSKHHGSSLRTNPAYSPTPGFTVPRNSELAVL